MRAPASARRGGRSVDRHHLDRRRSEMLRTANRIRIRGAARLHPQHVGRLHSTRLRTIGELQSPVRLIPVFHNGHGGALGALVSSAHLPVLIKIAAVYIRIPDFSQPQIYPTLQSCWIPASSYNTAKDGEILEETLRFHHITIRIASYGGTVRDACSRLRRGRGHRRRKH